MNIWKTYHGGKQWTPSRTRTGNQQLNNFQAETSWHQTTQPQKNPGLIYTNYFSIKLHGIFPKIGYFHLFFLLPKVACYFLGWSPRIVRSSQQVMQLRESLFGNIPPLTNWGTMDLEFRGDASIFIYIKKKYIMKIYETIHVCIYIYIYLI